jgi:hypothetical protein
MPIESNKRDSLCIHICIYMDAQRDYNKTRVIAVVAICIEVLMRYDYQLAL